jgi:uncharacterized protein
MSDAKSPPDLSMDEILAQIRRIIAEDDQPGRSSTSSAATSSAATAASTATASAVTPNAATGVAAGGGAAAKDIAGDTTGAADDIFDLTEAINEDGSVRHLAPIGSASEPEASRPDAPSPTAVPEPAVAPGGSTPGGLSDAAASAAAAAFAGSSAPGEPPPQRELPLGAGVRTLEDIVRDLLKPIVQTWLDEHLAEIVERLVQAEIAGIGKSEPA